MGLIRFLIWSLLLYIGYRIIKYLIYGNKEVAAPSKERIEETVQDPVCKLFLAKEDAVVGTLEGKRHYFCSMDCLEKFREQIDDKKS